MFRSNLQFNLVAAFAAVLMSAVAVGAAVAPATHVAIPAATISA